MTEEFPAYIEALGKPKVVLTLDNNYIQAINLDSDRTTRRVLAKANFYVVGEVFGVLRKGKIIVDTKVIATVVSGYGVGELLNGKVITEIYFNKVPTASQGYKSQAMVYFKYVIC